MQKPTKIVLVTGGFDPLHSGHIEYFKAAKKLGDLLIVGLNSDSWLARKKGQPFMPFTERQHIIEHLYMVNHCILYDDSDGSSIEAIKNVRMMYPEGEIIYPADFQQPVDLSLQLANSETGVIQRNPQIAFSSIAIDATTSGAQVPLPDKWDTALFDATSWAGPSGLGILAVNSAKYRYPIPHIAPIRAPGTYSLPLLIAAAVALENYSPIDPTLRTEVIQHFGKVPGVKIVAPDAPALANKISMTVDGVAEIGRAHV